MPPLGNRRALPGVQHMPFGGASLPERVDYEGAQAIISAHFPVSPRQTRRLLAKLPRVYVGKRPLFTSVDVLALARRSLDEARTVPANSPPSRPRTAA